MAVTTAAERRIAQALRTIGPRNGLHLDDRQVLLAARLAARAAARPRPVDTLPPGRPSRPGRPGPPVRGAVVAASQLTGEQVELLRALAACRGTRAALGAVLGASESSLKGRLSRLYKALGVSSRVGVLEAGRRLGVLGGGPG